MQVKSIAECFAILSTSIKLPFVLKTFVLSIFEWPLKSGFTVILNIAKSLQRIEGFYNVKVKSRVRDEGSS